MIKIERKIQYYKDYYKDEENKVWCYFIKSQRNPCDCGSNCYHYEYDGVKIIGVCNACKSDIYELKNEYVKEELNNGVWK